EAGMRPFDYAQRVLESRRDWLTVPNGITAFRLLLAPVYIALQWTLHPAVALAVFALAMALDAVDGLAARLLNQRSKLGGLLDPIADKVLVFVALLSLWPAHRAPAWLLGVVLSRDGMMVVGALVVKRKHLEIPAAP